MSGSSDLCERGSGSSSVIDDFAFLAVLDAYKWWITNDFGFLQLTRFLDENGEIGRKMGRYEASVMRRIARAYMVSRNIPSHEEDKQAHHLAALLNSKGMQSILQLPFEQRAITFKDFI